MYSIINYKIELLFYIKIFMINIICDLFKMTTEKTKEKDHSYVDKHTHTLFFNDINNIIIKNSIE